MVATVLQPIVDGTTLAVQPGRTASSGPARPASRTEKQAIDCVLITKDNAAKFNNFVFSG